MTETLEVNNDREREPSYEQLRAEALADPLSDTRSINLRTRILHEADGYRDAPSRVIQFSESLEPLTYAENNGVILFVDSEGIPKLAAATSKRMAAINERGYKESDIYVPFSVTRPADVNSQWYWDKVRLMDVAEQHGVELAKSDPEKHPEGQWVQLREGQALIDGAGVIRRVPEKTYYDKARTVGQYSENHNIMAFVDPAGRHWEGPVTRDNLRWIQETGYKYGEVGVWLSNHELAPDAPDANIKQHWKEIIEHERAPAA